MINDSDLKEITPVPADKEFSHGHVIGGVPIPKAQRVGLFDPSEWEVFVEEWASSLKLRFKAVRRFGGAGDLGIDVAGFLTTSTFAGGWINHQCKRFGSAMAPNQAWADIGKLMYYTWKGEYPAPDEYLFVCSRGVGTTLSKLLATPDELRRELVNNWGKYCRTAISSKFEVELTEPLLTHIEKFDFTIFGHVSVVQLIEEHFVTPFHAVRFGGGLPARGKSSVPNEIQVGESRYVEQLLEAYSENVGKSLEAPSDLVSDDDLSRDFLRQRERFYSAESLRNFARDNVPPGTFEALQDDAYDAVIDTCDRDFPCGRTRMRETLEKAQQTQFNASPLFSAILEKDKKGICHQLANEDRLTWVRSK